MLHLFNPIIVNLVFTKTNNTRAPFLEQPRDHFLQRTYWYSPITHELKIKQFVKLFKISKQNAICCPLVVHILSKVKLSTYRAEHVLDWSNCKTCRDFLHPVRVGRASHGQLSDPFLQVAGLDVASFSCKQHKIKHPVLRCGHIYCYSAKFRRWSEAISMGIYSFWNSMWGRKLSTRKFHVRFNWSSKFDTLTPRNLLGLMETSVMLCFTLANVTHCKSICYSPWFWNYIIVAFLLFSALCGMVSTVWFPIGVHHEDGLMSFGFSLYAGWVGLALCFFGSSVMICCSRGDDQSQNPENHYYYSKHSGVTNSGPPINSHAKSAHVWEWRHTG